MKSFGIRITAAAALLLAPYAATAAWLASKDGLIAAAAFLLAACAGLFVLLAIARGLRKFYLLHLPIFAVSLLIAGYAIIADQLPGYAIAYVLATSSWEEVRGFLAPWREFMLPIAFAAAILVYLWLGIRLPGHANSWTRNARVRRTAIGAFALLTLVVAEDPNMVMLGIAASPVAGAVIFATGPLSAARETLEGVLLRKRPYGATRRGTREIHIFIVGESSRRDSWSAYGYGRRTTPVMEVLRNEAILLTNVTADANTTVYAVPMLLTGLDPEEFQFDAVRGNLVDLVNEAGYRSSWLDNQDVSICRMVGMQANETHYTITVPKPAYAVYPSDGVLLPEFARQLARPGPPLFIGLHVYGSHSSYADRYPESFRRFGDPGVRSNRYSQSSQELLDTYDNSILYADWFLGRIIEQARTLDVPATVTYVSDHGEELYALDGRSGHGLGNYSARAFDIPAFVWVNAAYRSRHPDKVQALIANAAKDIRSHDFFYTAADLMGIEWSGADPQRSFASPRFAPDVKSRYMAGGKLVARTDPGTSDEPADAMAAFRKSRGAVLK